MAAFQPNGAKIRLQGSTPLNSQWPYFADDEIEAVVAILRSGKVNYWTGNEGRNFESEFAAKFGAKHAVAVANGTVSLEACLLALGIKPGDEVIVTPRSFLASVTSVITVGARPVFADIDPESGNLTAKTIEAVVTKRTKAVLLVHLAGWPCEMEPIMDLAQAHGFAVIEDCAQAHGATIDQKNVGHFGLLASWSFCQDKIMTTGGEGGMVTTDDSTLWSKIWSLKDHGKNYDTVYHRSHPVGFRWLHESLGTNWRMTEMQSAIGRLQLTKLDDWVDQRRRNAEILANGMAGLAGLTVPRPRPGIHHAYYKFYTIIQPQALRSDYDQMRLIAEINEEGAPAFSGSCSEIYLEKVIQDLGLAPENPLPAAKVLGETSLMFPVHPTLPEQALHQTVDAVRKVFKRAHR